jgi:hypothetical protein
LFPSSFGRERRKKHVKQCASLDLYRRTEPSLLAQTCGSHCYSRLHLP